MVVYEKTLLKSDFNLRKDYKPKRNRDAKGN